MRNTLSGGGPWLGAIAGRTMRVVIVTVELIVIIHSNRNNHDHTNDGVPFTYPRHTRDGGEGRLCHAAATKGPRCTCSWTPPWRSRPSASRPGRTERARRGVTCDASVLRLSVRSICYRMCMGQMIKGSYVQQTQSGSEVQRVKPTKLKATPPDKVGAQVAKRRKSTHGTLTRAQ